MRAAGGPDWGLQGQAESSDAMIWVAELLDACGDKEVGRETAKTEPESGTVEQASAGAGSPGPIIPVGSGGDDGGDTPDLPDHPFADAGGPPRADVAGEPGGEPGEGFFEEVFGWLADLLASIFGRPGSEGADDLAGGPEEERYIPDPPPDLSGDVVFIEYIPDGGAEPMSDPADLDPMPEDDLELL